MYSYKSTPDAVPHSRSLYREGKEEGEQGPPKRRPMHIGVDPRVFRGPTAGPHAWARAAAEEEAAKRAKEAEEREARRKARYRPFAAKITIEREAPGASSLAAASMTVLEGPAFETKQAEAGAGVAATGPLAATALKGNAGAPPKDGRRPKKVAEGRPGAWHAARPRRLGKGGPVVVGDGKLSFASMTARGKDGSVFDFVDPGADGEPVDLSAHLEERREAPVMVDVGAQCDEDVFVPQEPPARILAPKTGRDTGTHMDAFDSGTSDAAPFNFSREVGPLVEVLCAKTLEQALSEVVEEEELDVLQHRRARVEGALEAEKSRISAEESRALEAARSKRHAVGLARVAARRRHGAAKKVACLHVGSRLVQNTLAATFSSFRRRGVFTLPERREAVEFLPSVLAGASKMMEQRSLANTLADELIKAALQRQRDLKAEQDRKIEEAARRKRHYIIVLIPWPEGMPGPKIPKSSEDNDEEEEEEEPENDEDDEETQNKAEKPLTPRLPPPEHVSVGPIPVARIDTVATVEERLLLWVREHPSPVVEQAIRGRILRLAYRGKLLDPNATLLDFSPAQFAALEIRNEPDPNAPQEEDQQEEEQEENEAKDEEN